MHLFKCQRRYAQGCQVSVSVISMHTLFFYVVSQVFINHNKVRLTVYTFAPRPLDGKKIRHYIDPVEMAKLDPGKLVHECSEHTDTVRNGFFPCYHFQVNFQKLEFT